MRHCNSVFQAEDIWFLLDSGKYANRKLYLAACPICGKKIALYAYCDTEKEEYFEQYFYSGGEKRIREKFKKEIVSTLLGYRTKYKAPFGFKYGKNVEIKRNGKVVGVKQYACDFYGNKELVKKVEQG